MPINPVERIADERSDELYQARRSVDGVVIRDLRRSLRNPYARSDRLTELNQSDLAELLGVSSWTQVSYWENQKKRIGDDSIITAYRMRNVLTEMPEFAPEEKYLYLVHPRDALLIGVSVSPIELLRMPSSLGFQAVMHALHTNKPTPESLRALAPAWRIMKPKART